MEDGGLFMENLYSPLEKSNELIGKMFENKFCPLTLALIVFKRVLLGQLEAMSSLKSNFAVSKFGMTMIRGQDL